MMLIWMLMALSFSCSKKMPSLLKNNEFNATVVLLSGTTVNINARGNKALLGCGIFGGSTYVDGTNVTNEAVYINVSDSIIKCVSRARTYTDTGIDVISCRYFPDATSQTAPVYTNNRKNPASVTFTTVSATYMEGSFNAVCYKTNLDSVRVTGTFKGNVTH
jgi:hypothetical protein